MYRKNDQRGKSISILAIKSISNGYNVFTKTKGVNPIEILKVLHSFYFAYIKQITH